MTAAFVNRSTMLQRLQSTFDIGDIAHRWFQSYLSGRKHHVRRGSHLVCGVPQGSVLAPILCVAYIVDLSQLIESSGLSPSLYADDVQAYG